jgi:hypothetical protein
LKTHLLTFALIALLLATPRPSTAQCDGCPGDLDGNGQVTVDEIIAVVNAALAPCDSQLLFNEEFLGGQLSARRWTASANGYPGDAIAVAGGALRLGVSGTEAADFPYVASGALPVPESGRVELEVVMRFTGTGANASHFTVLGANGRSLVRIRNDSALGLTVSVPGARGSLNQFDPTATHTYTLAFRGEHLDVNVDGMQVFGNFPVDSQPQRVWMGQPTIGQRFGIDETDERPTGVDDTGMVVARSWSPAEWSTIELDAVRVRRLAETN